MIVRLWKGRATQNRRDAYVEHFNTEVLPDLNALEGFLGARLMRRTVGDGVEFLVMTEWDSLEAIKRFAGEDYEKAVVEPSAVAALESFDETVIHYEVVTRSGH